MTVCIPSIPIRNSLLGRALASVARQTAHAPRVIVEMDGRRTGAAATRQRALERVETPYVAFLDDDDELFPRHLELLLAEQKRTGADLVYPWFEVHGGTDPIAHHFGKPFDADELRRGNYIPITVLARTQSVLDAGGFREETNEQGWTNEDWVCWRSMADNGATFVHLPRRTWTWYHHGQNTSGNARNW